MSFMPGEFFLNANAGHSGRPSSFPSRRANENNRVEHMMQIACHAVGCLHASMSVPKSAQEERFAATASAIAEEKEAV